MNNELYHWKYIKREKVGGKWKYYYDTGSLKKDAKNFVKDPVGTKAKAQYRKTQQKYIDASNVGNGRSMSDLYYRDERKKAQELTKRGIKYIPTELKSPFAKDKNVGRKAVADLKREEHAKIEMNRAKKAYDKTALGKLEKSASNTRHLINEAKKTVKDKLGYDERDALDKAQKEVNETSYNKANALINAKDAYDYAERYGDDSFYETRADEYGKAKESHDKAVSKRDKAKAVYYDTPIGKLAEAGERIDAAKDYVEDLLKRKKSATFKSTTDELKELEEFERMLEKRKKK